MMQFFGFVIAFAFDNVEANFNPKTLAYTTFTFFLHGFIYGSFFISYYYFINYKVHQAQLISYNQSLADSRINQLKIQLNPHFLFNNLNVLDQLIEEDKDKASEFLNEFAEIYRYVLQASDKKLTTINEEILFAQQYFNIMQHKYGKAYQLVIQNNLNEGYIVPMSLQLLVENAIQHNFGTDEKPTIINITITDKIEVSNNINRKAIIKATSGRALNNLKEQYKLLTEHPIEIIQSKETFTLVIPIVKRSLI